MLDCVRVCLQTLSTKGKCEIIIQKVIIIIKNNIHNSNNNDSSCDYNYILYTQVFQNYLFTIMSKLSRSV